MRYKEAKTSNRNSGNRVLLLFTEVGNQWLYDSRWIKPKERVHVLLRKIFGLKPWHDTPINDKPYAMYTLKQINEFTSRDANKKYTIVEIGCGLGDIIGNISCMGHRIGFDQTIETIKCAKLLHPLTRFEVGSFDNVAIGKIDVLIMVGFLHCIDDDDLVVSLNRLLSQNDVGMICFDTQLRESQDYPHIHKGNELFSGKYELIKRSKGFSCSGNNRRYIEFWRKNA